MWNLKVKLVNITERKPIPDTENKLAVASGERDRGRSNKGIGD